MPPPEPVEPVEPDEADEADEAAEPAQLDALEPPTEPAPALWRAWKMARGILLNAILPRPNLRTPAAREALRNKLAEPPRRRKLQAYSFRPP